MSSSLRLARLVLLAVALLAASGPPAEAHGGRDSAVVQAWAEQLYTSIRQTSIPPPVASRRIGYFGVALHESVVGGRRLGLSLDGQLNGLSGVPHPDPGHAYYWPECANAAARRVLDGLFAGAPQAQFDAFAALEAQHRAAAGEAGVSHDVLDRSTAFGRSVADAILAWAATDGFAQYNNCPYTAPQGEGLWEPTPPGFRPPLQPCWGQLRTFAIPSGETCDPGPPMPFSTDPESECYREARLVYDTVNDLTDEQEAIARFWSDDPGTTGTPPGHWLSIAAQLMEQQGLDLGAACELLARTGIAVADGFIGCWNTKFRYSLLRPITYIQDHIDSEWTSLLTTPPFPEYTSGHSTQSGAAYSVMHDMLGDVPFTDHTHDDRGLPARSFNTFQQAAAEAAVSRLYGGIHYNNTDNIGVAQGECIAREILSRVDFDRCAGGDIFPPAAGDGRVTLLDLVQGWRSLGPGAAASDRVRLCGDLHPGTYTCSLRGRRNWCPEGDGRFTIGDFIVMQRLTSGRIRLNCQSCPEAASQVVAESWTPGDVTADAQAGIGDVVRLLRVAVGLDVLSASDALRGDVAPLVRDGEAGGDGGINVADAVAVLRASVGLSTLQWPARSLDVVLAQDARRVAFSATIEGIPAWAHVEGWQAEACTTESGSFEDVDGAWDITCVGDEIEREAAGVLATVTYRGPRALDPASLTLTTELADATPATVVAPMILAGR